MIGLPVEHPQMGRGPELPKEILEQAGKAQEEEPQKEKEIR